jgi:hypothetical protein
MLAVVGVAVMAFLTTQCSTNPETGAEVQNAPDAAGAQQAASAEGEHSPSRIAVAELKAKLDSGEKFLLIDVREDHELEEDGAIAGAIHIPVGELDARMADIPKDAQIVFY